MSEFLLALLAFVPILSAAVLLVGLRLPAKIVMPIAFLVTLIIAYLFWEIPIVQLVASSIQGLFITFDILFIIFGAIILLQLLNYSGAIAVIRSGFTDVSRDRRIQVIILVWLFGSFMEGAAGFGTPAAVVAPLLVGMGFPGFCAVMLGMMVQSTAVTFGAVGTPILVGVTSGIQSAELSSELILMGIDFSSYLELVVTEVVLIHGIVGTTMPTIMVCMMTRFFGKNKSWKEGLEILPFALFAGLSFTIPYALAGVFLGPEFPSLLGSLVGLTIVVFAARRGFLMPKQIWEFDDEKNWPRAWLGSLKISIKEHAPGTSMSLLKAWFPYLILAALLVLTRLPQFPLKAWLTSINISWDAILETTISASSAPLYLPGTMLLTAGLAAIILHRLRLIQIKAAFADSAKMLLGAGFVLIFTVPMVRIYINSGINPSDLPGMPIAMAAFVASTVGDIYPLFAPSIGALGAFIAGSNTVSNLMFSLFQLGVALKLSIPTQVIVALQAVGAAAGNMIAIHNIVAASATVGFLGREGMVLKRTIIPTIYYLILVGLLGLLLV